MIGALLGVQPAREYVDKDGVLHRPYTVGVSVGDGSVSLQYPDEVTARAAVPVGVRRFATVKLRFVARGNFNREAGVSMPVSFRGL